MPAAAHRRSAAPSPKHTFSLPALVGEPMLDSGGSYGKPGPLAGTEGQVHWISADLEYGRTPIQSRHRVREIQSAS
ncbi:uncharacterized [Tachysurus ichikawai]